MKKINGVDRMNEYISSILSGDKVSNSYIKSMCQRHLDWLEKDDRYFDIEECNKIISIVEKYLVTNDGSTIYLYNFQCWILCQIYGWKWSKDDRRICGRALLMVARGAGKSFLCALLAFIDMLFPNKNDKNAPNTIIGSATKSLAGEVFDQFKNMLTRSPISKYFKIPKSVYKHQGVVKFEKNSSTCSTTSAESKNDGNNISLAVIDEIHYLKNSDLIKSLEYSFGKRDNPLLIMITTAGTELEGILKSYHDIYKMDILDGNLPDDTFPVLYILDDGDMKDWTKCLDGDIKDRLVNKVQPLYDQKDQDKMRRLYDTTLASAIKFPSESDEFRTKMLNIFVTNSEETWIDNSKIKSRMSKLDFEEFRGWNAWVGIDLSSVSDLTSISWCFYNSDTNQYRFKTLSYVPSFGLKQRRNLPFWNRMVNNGYLKTTEGNTVNYDIIIEEFNDINKKYDFNIECVLYDQWNSTHFIAELENDGYFCVKHGQGNAAFNPPTRELERLILDDQYDIIIDYSELTRLCFTNVVLVENNSNLVKPKRKNHSYKIDIVISMLQALGGLLFDLKNGYGSDDDVYVINY